VYDNMAFGLKLRGADKGAIDQKVRQAATILNLTEYLDRFPRQLSGGQRQRVAMGRAIVRDPQVFLFDEPLSNLDAKLRVQMRTEIRELHQRLKSTSVYVTHDQIEAMTMADKIVVMRDGHIEQSGAPLEVYDRPDNLFVAGFIGSPAMNLVEGSVKRSGASASVITSDGKALPIAPGAAASDGTKVIYGIRPDHITLANGGGSLDVEVAVVEPTGAETLVVGKFGKTEIQAAFRERHAFRPGQRVPMMPVLDKVHLFDAGSGRRLA
ncbi:MAG: ATP-binding cassette domain-containing protein, partial [Alphaproteobacteria bacterium]|nr:ATP-binding cassette domain-containing protein [Alphaproteobacteria bacterium]